MQLSSTPLLAALELAFLFLLAWCHVRRKPYRATIAPVWLYFLWLTIYGVSTSLLGARGFYVSEELLRTLPGLWLALATVIAAVAPVLFFRGVRTGLREIADATPWHWFAYFHGLRIAALGTAYKTMTGEFPAYFEYLIGIPDLLFGISAFWIAQKAKKGSLTMRGFLLWNLLGAFIIVPWAPLLIQLGLPGPLHLITGTPDATAILAYPMSIAPVFGVPMFVLVNLWVAWRLLEHLNESSGTGRASDDSGNGLRMQATRA